jgi:hypothetical protein
VCEALVVVLYSLHVSCVQFCAMCFSNCSHASNSKHIINGLQMAEYLVLHIAKCNVMVFKTLCVYSACLCIVLFSFCTDYFS